MLTIWRMIIWWDMGEELEIQQSVSKGLEEIRWWMLNGNCAVSSRRKLTHDSLRDR